MNGQVQELRVLGAFNGLGDYLLLLVMMMLLMIVMLSMLF